VSTQISFLFLFLFNRTIIIRLLREHLKQVAIILPVPIIKVPNFRSLVTYISTVIFHIENRLSKLIKCVLVYQLVKVIVTSCNNL